MPQEASGLIVTGLLSGAVGYGLRQEEVDRLVYRVAALKRQNGLKDLELMMVNLQMTLKDWEITRLKQQLATLQEDKDG